MIVYDLAEWQMRIYLCCGRRRIKVVSIVSYFEFWFGDGCSAEKIRRFVART